MMIEAIVFHGTVAQIGYSQDCLNKVETGMKLNKSLLPRIRHSPSIFSQIMIEAIDVDNPSTI